MHSEGGDWVVRIVIAGSGYMGAVHSERLSQIPNVHVVGVLARSLGSAETLAAPWGARATTSLEELLAIPCDAVDICLPTDRHATTALAAFAAKRHVICEKPIALRVEDALTMAAAAQAADRLLLIAHVLRFWPEYRAARDLVRAGEIGQPTAALARRLKYSASDPLTNRRESGGPVVDLQIHDVDFLQWCFGTTPLRVAAAGSEYHTFSTLVFSDGAASIEAGSDLPAGYPFASQVEIRGDRGFLSYLYRAGGERVEQAGGESLLRLWRQSGTAVLPAVPPGEAYALELEHFVDCIRRHEPSAIITPQEAAQALQTSLALRDALKGGAMAVPQLQ